MTIDGIKSDIRDMLSEVTDIDVNTIKNEDLLFDDIGLTSIVIVQIYVFCQEKYGIAMHDEVNMHAAISIDYIANLVYKKIQGKVEEDYENRG